MRTIKVRSSRSRAQRIKVHRQGEVPAEPRPDKHSHHVLPAASGPAAAADTNAIRGYR